MPEDVEPQALYAEIVKLMAEGRKDREIATKLKIGIRTVERRRAELMRRIEVKTHVALGAYAQRAGWLS